MKRLLLLLPMLLGAGSPNCAQAQQTSTYKHKALIYDVADGEAAVYGYLRYDTKYRTNGLTTFRTNTPSTYSLIKDYGNIPGKTPIFTAGTYVGKDYLAYVSGYEPSLDSIFVYPKTTTIRERIYKPPNKWHIGITGGYGYSFKTKQATPYVGIGITYSLFSF